MRLHRVLTLLAMAVATGLALIWVEGQNFRLRQKLTELHYDRDRLVEEHARLRLAASRLAAPAQVLESLRHADTPLEEPRPSLR